MKTPRPETPEQAREVLFQVTAMYADDPSPMNFTIMVHAAVLLREIAQEVAGAAHGR